MAILTSKACGWLRARCNSGGLITELAVGGGQEAMSTDYLSSLFVNMRLNLP
jgi:hypothetical protein